MATTNHTSVRRRTGMSLAAAALVFGAVFSATPIAFAVPEDDGGLDVDDYDRCVRLETDKGQDTADVTRFCCQTFGGIYKPEDPWNCYAPPAERAPEEGAATTKPGAPPPVLQPDLAPPPTTTTPPLLAPAPAPGLAPR